MRDDTGYELPPEGCLWVSFSSILQGDHCGVDIATAAHTSLLQQHGLLRSSSNMVANKPLVSEHLAEGLVIDDYFSVAITPHEQTGVTCSKRNYDVANQAYQKYGLLGSPHKDLVDVEEGRVIGAYLNGSDRAAQHGMVTVAAPIAKRLGLAYLSVLLAQLPYTSDALHLCLVGGWVSCLTYRRPLMSVLSRCFKMVDMDSFDRDNPRIIALPRKTADELVLLAVLMPMVSTDIATDFEHRVFCTDALSFKGAILSAPVTRDVAEVLWKTSRSKGAYTRLLTPLESLLKNLDALEEHENPAPEQPQIARPLACVYDFIEVFSGASKITAFLKEMGFVCGPPLDLSISAEYDLTRVHVIAWLTSMVVDGKLLAFFLSPPCTTFSIMRRPRLRSAESPFGFDPEDDQTSAGTQLACRSMQLMYVGARHDAAGISETPYSSYMKWLPAWQTVKRLPNSQEVRCDSCQFASHHLKSFRFLGVNVDLAAVRKRCKCLERHLQVQGKFTKVSATYTDELAFALATIFAESIQARKEAARQLEQGPTAGLESQLVNDLMQSLPWKVSRQWTFRRRSHINILEESSLLKLCNDIAKLGVPKRISVMVDSNVVKCATSKGRSSSLGLSSILRRVCALITAAGIYLNIPFCPTRLNAADDPTRDCPLRSPIEGLGASAMSRDELFDLAAFPKLRKWASNWARLILRVLGLKALHFANRAVYRLPLPIKDAPCHACPHDALDFDATLGYPGEGPQPFFVLSSMFILLSRALGASFVILWTWFQVLHVPARSRRWSFRDPIGLTVAPPCGSYACCPPLRPRVLPLLLLGLLCSIDCAGAMPINPRTPAETRRVFERSLRPDLASGRPVTDATLNLREKYWQALIAWTTENGYGFEQALELYHANIEEINFVLVKYGRTLYRAGKSYNQYAETINCLVSKKPGLRRLMTAAWDLGFSWSKQEPSQHHIPMPVPILLSMLVTGLMWGWRRFCGIIALGFGGLLRPGELVAAKREDLLLPIDTGFSVPFALMSIKEPKSRFTYARHQSTKIDSEDLVQLLSFSFSDLRPHEKLWPYSAQILRSRFKSVLTALTLSTVSVPGNRCLDLGSLRSGGATYIILMTENSELCRRRGRWANHRMMEVYVQETMALQYMSLIRPHVRSRIVTVSSFFLAVFEQASKLAAAKIPESTWFTILSRRQ